MFDDLSDPFTAYLAYDMAHKTVIAVSTETVVGFACDADSPIAIDRLMEIKQRGFNSDKMFALVPRRKNDLYRYADVPKYAVPLIKKHLPGPVTFIFKKNPKFKNYYFDHYDTIGIRVPDAPTVSELLKVMDGPILLTSANKKGKKPLKTQEEIERAFDGIYMMLLDYSLGSGVPSTIVDCTGDEPKILREGEVKL